MDKTMNAEKVLANVNACIAELEEANKNGTWTNRMHLSRWNRKLKNWIKVFKIDEVYAELSIFDWWPETLSMSNLKLMKDFIEKAIKLGYNGYVCFKVGASGCANGMWAYKEESTDGFSPNGEVLYRSFTPDYVGWDAKLANGTWVSDIAETNCTNTPFKVVKNMVINQ